ncbi:hypothetical protein L207DRAFT_89815 [Hyaloscypha variabilis F]|uniref:Uncharacterized protein n=1 Tax=Hyaloscypha variabilis (strain UAMH 11265 / GT02V1 / F) TaxID=1149755 RepID=A0A2J6RE34_HYAVF|nr:hypothetical protein L207DRAFT_89815 [Hyaloscypha variabilis F]
MVEGIDETTMLVQRKTGQSYVFTSKIGVLNFSTHPRCRPSPRFRVWRRCLQQMHNLKPPPPNYPVRFSTCLSFCPSRHVICGVLPTCMRFCTKRKIYSKLRYIIFAFAAELNSLPANAPIAFSSQPTGSPSVQNRVHDAASSSGEVDLSPSIWPRAYTDSKLKRSGAAPQSTSLRLGDLVQIQIWPISHM